MNATSREGIKIGRHRIRFVMQKKRNGSFVLYQQIGFQRPDERARWGDRVMCYGISVEFSLRGAKNLMHRRIRMIRKSGRY